MDFINEITKRLYHLEIDLIDIKCKYSMLKDYNIIDEMYLSIKYLGSEINIMEQIKCLIDSVCTEQRIVVNNIYMKL